MSYIGHSPEISGLYSGMRGLLCPECDVRYRTYPWTPVVERRSVQVRHGRKCQRTADACSWPRDPQHPRKRVALSHKYSNGRATGRFFVECLS
jgi:hypothetical protein